MNLKQKLKRAYNYKGNLPVKCHVCGNENVDAGCLMCMILGVHCTKCGLKLGVEYEQYYVGKHKDLKAYERKLLTIAIKLWNKEINPNDLIKDIKVRCPWCGDYASVEDVKKGKGKCPFCSKYMEIID